LIGDPRNRIQEIGSRQLLDEGPPIAPGPPPTAESGVWIANVATGGIATYPGTRKLILSGFAEAAAAARAVFSRICCW
jgi:hypothetical protein